MGFGSYWALPPCIYSQEAVDVEQAWAVAGMADTATVRVIAVLHGGSRRASAMKRCTLHPVMASGIINTDPGGCRPGRMLTWSHSLRAKGVNMQRMLWRVTYGWALVGLLIASNFTGVVWGGETGGVTLHHQAAGLAARLTTQPSPPRAGENLLRVGLTDVQNQALPHAQVRLVITQARTMPGMHSDRPQEVEATSTHGGV